MIETRQRPKGRVEVTFVLPGDPAPASVVGDFNDWDPAAHRMRERGDGRYVASVEVPQGTVLRFRYLTSDGDERDEPQATIQQEDDGRTVSVAMV